MSRPVAKLRKAAEAVAALFMLLMFATFIVQVAIRYGARLDGLVETLPFLDPTYYGWTLEFCLALWVWLIFWGNAFVVRDVDHVTFDLLSSAAPWRVRRILIILTGLVIAAGLLLSIAPTWDRFAILRLKQSATLGDLFGDWIRMRDIYVIYILFLVVVAARYLWAVWRAFRSSTADPFEHQDDVSGETGR
ncbi:TRAP transporter small permease subunit [Fulvimarina sp. MAC8]|uniref:TRAP transporter small permease n=1 Tax=Fulvimarina sp. MAC8 TaxID=3162874 RepID=UPI0032F0693E